MSNNDSKTQKQRHVMISFIKESRDTCFRIKDCLEKLLNIKLWMDTDNIYGNIWGAMSNAIDQSYCILICMTEKYKESRYCKFEAEYMFKTNKPFIALLMQKS